MKALYLILKISTGLSVAAVGATVGVSVTEKVTQTDRSEIRREIGDLDSLHRAFHLEATALDLRIYRALSNTQTLKRQTRRLFPADTAALTITFPDSATWRVFQEILKQQ